MYVFVFAALYSLETLPAATGAWTVDRLIERRIGCWHTLAEPGATSPIEIKPVEAAAPETPTSS